MSFDAKSEILAAIAKTDDQNMKMVLLLLLGVLEEIGGKIDSMRSDEKGLREAVLNGHESVHHEHHEWVARQIKTDCADICGWAKSKMDAEAEAEKDAKADKRIAREAAIRQLVTVAIGAIAGAAGVLWALK